MTTLIYTFALGVDPPYYKDIIAQIYFFKKILIYSSLFLISLPGRNIQTDNATKLNGLNIDDNKNIITVTIMPFPKLPVISQNLFTQLTIFKYNRIKARIIAIGNKRKILNKLALSKRKSIKRKTQKKLNLPIGPSIFHILSLSSKFCIQTSTLFFNYNTW